MRTLTLVLMFFLLPLVVSANNGAAAEINFLLESVDNSGCTFVRNGDRYDAHEAAKHLRMKYEKGKRYASTADRFIENLASKSFLSKKLYYIECEGAEPVPSGEWLSRLLQDFRTSST